MPLTEGLGLQQKMDVVSKEGPDWPKWVSGNYQRDNIDYETDEWKWGDSWLTRMEGAIYIISWVQAGYSLFRYTQPATLGKGEAIIWTPFMLNMTGVPHTMRWVMDTLPARVIIKELGHDVRIPD